MEEFKGNFETKSNEKFTCASWGHGSVVQLVYLSEKYHNIQVLDDIYS